MDITSFLKLCEMKKRIWTRGVQHEDLKDAARNLAQDEYEKIIEAEAKQSTC